MTHHTSSQHRTSLPSLHAHRRAGLSLLLGALLLSTSCRDTTPLVAPTQKPEPMAALAGESPLADTLARALALAMADAKIREQVRDDLRDAPT